MVCERDKEPAKIENPAASMPMKFSVVVNGFVQ